MEGIFEDPGFGSLRYLSLICFLFLSIKDKSGYLLCHGSDLRYFSRIQKRMCGTAKGSADIESDHKLPRAARVDGMCDIHDGSKIEGS